MDYNHIRDLWLYTLYIILCMLSISLLGDYYMGFVGGGHIWIVWVIATGSLVLAIHKFCKLLVLGGKTNGITNNDG